MITSIIEDKRQRGCSIKCLDKTQLALRFGRTLDLQDTIEDAGETLSQLLES
jgi:hypothetical protein